MKVASSAAASAHGSLQVGSLHLGPLAEGLDLKSQTMAGIGLRGGAGIGLCSGSSQNVNFLSVNKPVEALEPTLVGNLFTGRATESDGSHGGGRFDVGGDVDHIGEDGPVESAVHLTTVKADPKPKGLLEPVAPKVEGVEVLLEGLGGRQGVGNAGELGYHTVSRCGVNGSCVPVDGTLHEVVIGAERGLDGQSVLTLFHPGATGAVDVHSADVRRAGPQDLLEPNDL